MKVVVTDYNPEWEKEFDREAEKLREAFGGGLVAVHHIGSTSVPGLGGKADYRHHARRKGHRRSGQGGARPRKSSAMRGWGNTVSPGRRYFRKGGDNRTHQLHVFAESSAAEIARHLAFRDYLRRHPDEATEYGTLKRALAKKFPGDIEGYCDGKDAFVKATEREAMKEYTALVRFSRNRALFVDMAECVRRGAARVLRADGKGVLLYEKSSGIHMLEANSAEDARALLRETPLQMPEGDRKFIVAHGDGVRDAVYDLLSVRAETACYQVMYAGKPLPLGGKLRFGLPDGRRRKKSKRNTSWNLPKTSKDCAPKARSGADTKGRAGLLWASSADIPREAWGFCRYFPRTGAAATARSWKAS